jgi:hypothetical protein
MGTEIESKMKHHNANIFWGGDSNGVMIQITSSHFLDIRESIIEQIQEEGFIVLTMEESCALCNVLLKFISEESVRRQELLKHQIREMKGLEKTIFDEVAFIPISDFAVMSVVVDMVSKVCPKKLSLGEEGTK